MNQAMGTMQTPDNGQPDAISRRLWWHGLVVFLLGLISGVLALSATPVFNSPRMALSSHLVGITTGMFVLITGLLVNRLRLSPRQLHVLFFTSIYGAYGNWLGSILLALFGAH